MTAMDTTFAAKIHDGSGENKLLLVALLDFATARDPAPLVPQDRRDRSTWRHVAALLEKAAIKGDNVTIALRMVLMLEGIEWQPKSNHAASRRR